MRTRTVLILGGCLIVAVVVVLPNLVPVHVGMRPSCVNNLRMLDGAKGQWALELHKNTNAAPSWDDLRPYFHGEMLSCPQHGYIFTRASRRIGVLLNYQSHGSVPAVSVTTPSNMTASVDAPFAVLANSLGSWRRAPEQQCLADVPR